MNKVFCWKDRETWPIDWPGCKIEPHSDEAYDLAYRLERDYDFFTAYHACRPVDVSSYYRDGLKVACHADLTKLAIDIFADGTFKEITRADVLAAAEAMPKTSDHYLYVALDDRFIISDCGHYLIYGSEYLIGIAVELTRKHYRDYRQHLMNFGKPAMFELQLPLSWIPSDVLADLASWMSRAVFNDEAAGEIDFAVTLDQPVPPEFIKSHFHPPVIEDPFTDFVWGENKEF